MSYRVKISSAKPKSAAPPPKVHPKTFSSVRGPYALQTAASAMETMMAMIMGASVARGGG